MVTMEELLASQSQQLKVLHKGQEIEGDIVAIGDKELVLDLGTKSEGIISTHDIPKDQLDSLKVGDKLKAYVYIPENEYGQTVLSLDRSALAAHPAGVKARLRGGSGRGGRSWGGGKGLDWSKFIQAQNQKSKLQGKVEEVNKGGLIIEIAGVRGFLPNSQVGFELLSKSGKDMGNLVGQDLEVIVIEVDQDNNKLIFSERGQVSPEIKENLKKFKTGQKVQGKIVAILPFGLVMSVTDRSSSGRDVSGIEGLVFISDVSWEKVEDLQNQFAAGEALEVLVLSLDEELGRLNLSIKQLSEDPFGKIAENYPVDEVVKGEISAVSTSGAAVKLEGGIEGFLAASKMDPDTTYEAGGVITLLVDSVDTKRRRINLAPFITSTEGLIYK